MTPALTPIFTGDWNQLMQSQYLQKESDPRRPEKAIAIEITHDDGSTVMYPDACREQVDCYRAPSRCIDNRLNLRMSRECKSWWIYTNGKTCEFEDSSLRTLTIKLIRIWPMYLVEHLLKGPSSSLVADIRHMSANTTTSNVESQPYNVVASYLFGPRPAPGQTPDPAPSRSDESYWDSDPHSGPHGRDCCDTLGY
jgi:hypothetical protein